MSLKHQCPANIQNMTMFSLNSPILLWGANTQGLEQNTIGIQKSR